ncbi:SDR family oxidoreductase [Marininema mesophilum]|uniref:SDR family oxidoreductase n=1 Tax=Marininema mesophilum TaxID=1048340 RepID=UPI0015A66185
MLGYPSTSSFLSTESLLQIAECQENIHFHFVSTVSVLGDLPEDVDEDVFAEDIFDWGQQHGNMYVERKFSAERLVHQRIAKGVG